MYTIGAWAVQWGEMYANGGVGTLYESRSRAGMHVFLRLGRGCG